MIRKTPLVTGEVYHVYNRGAHKQLIFNGEKDYRRFSLLLHIANSSEPLPLGELIKKYRGRSSGDIFTEVPVDKSLVDVLAYSLMPNHFHLVLRQKAESGISIFMKKTATAYSMYFNIKNEHSGVVFQGRFKSRHIDSNEYFRYIFSYVHLNQLSLQQPGWEDVGVKDMESSRKFMQKYPFSSFYDYSIGDRPEKIILATEDAPVFLKSHDDFEEFVKWYGEGKESSEIMTN